MGAGPDRGGIDRDLFLLVVTPPLPAREPGGRIFKHQKKEKSHDQEQVLGLRLRD